MTIFVFLVWISLCILAFFLSATACFKYPLFITDGIKSKSLLLWISSLFIFDVGSLLIGIMMNYDLLYFFLMFLLIQMSYVISILAAYVQLKIHSNQTGKTTANKYLRSASLWASSMSSIPLLIYLGLPSNLKLLLFAFIMAGLFWIVDYLFQRKYG